MNNERQFSYSIMAPALTIIKVFIVLGVIGALISGLMVILVIASAANGGGGPGATQGFVICGTLFVQCLITVLSLYILRCFVLCLDSIEKTVRRIEKNTRKIEQNMREDKKPAEREDNMP